MAIEDLATFSDENIQKLKRYHNIPDRFTGRQLLLMIAVNVLAKSIKKSFMTTINPEDFTEIIGGGGYGTIIKSNSGDIIGKFLNRNGQCGASKIEFEKHLKIYNAFETAIAASDYDQFCISKPIAFNTNTTTVLGTEYSCYYLMTLINPIDQNGLYHIVSQEEYAPTMNKVIGRRASEPISDNNPSRGFFATKSYINDKLLPGNGNLQTFTDVLRYMGFAFGTILFGAELLPIDVEYLLGKQNEKLCFTVLDFGLVVPVNFNNDPTKIANQIIDNILDIEIYYPSDEDDIQIVKQGITDAYNIFASQQKQQVLELILENW